jgi:hypothetical protein
MGNGTKGKRSLRWTIAPRTVIVKEEGSWLQDGPRWADFVDSDRRDNRGSGRRQDRLEDRQWLRRFLKEWDLDMIDAGRPEHRSSVRLLRSLHQTDCRVC